MSNIHSKTKVERRQFTNCSIIWMELSLRSEIRLSKSYAMRKELLLHEFRKPITTLPLHFTFMMWKFCSRYTLTASRTYPAKFVLSYLARVKPCHEYISGVLLSPRNLSSSSISTILMRSRFKWPAKDSNFGRSSSPRLINCLLGSKFISANHLLDWIVSGTVTGMCITLQIRVLFSPTSTVNIGWRFAFHRETGPLFCACLLSYFRSYPQGGSALVSFKNLGLRIIIN